MASSSCRSTTRGRRRRGGAGLRGARSPVAEGLGRRRRRHACAPPLDARVGVPIWRVHAPTRGVCSRLAVASIATMRARWQRRSSVLALALVGCGCACSGASGSTLMDSRSPPADAELVVADAPSTDDAAELDAWLAPVDADDAWDPEHASVTHDPLRQRRADPRLARDEEEHDHGASALSNLAKRVDRGRAIDRERDQRTRSLEQLRARAPRASWGRSSPFRTRLGPDILGIADLRKDDDASDTPVHRTGSAQGTQPGPLPYGSW